MIKLSRAIINQAVKDLPDSKLFFASKLFGQIATDIEIDTDSLVKQFNLIKEPKWITLLERRLIYNDMLPD